MRNGKALFKVLRLGIVDGVKSGTYSLVLETDGLQSKQLEFFYNCGKTQPSVLILTDQEASEYKSDLQSEIVKCKKEIATKQKQLESTREKVRQESGGTDDLQSSIQELHLKITSLLPELKDLDFSGKKEYLELKKSLRQKLKEFEKDPRRKPNYGSSQAIEQILRTAAEEGEESGIIGILGELAFVEDDVEAKVIARILGSKIQTILLQNQKVKGYLCTPILLGF
jgi:chromosome segregation ATPase